MTTTKRFLMESVILAIVLTALSFAVGMGLGWITTVNWLEVFAVFTSYSCTWLCTRQSRWNYPIGIASVIAYSVLFWQWSLPALAAFNLYLAGSLIYGWFRWGPDKSGRPVTRIAPEWLPAYALLGVAILALYLGANMLFNPAGLVGLNWIDVGLAVASGVAQFMLDNKKLENWTVWAGINIVSIPYYWHIGLTFVAFQYIFFLVNTFIGRAQWKASMEPEKVLTAEQEHEEYIRSGMWI